MGRDRNDLINMKKQVVVPRTLGLKAMTAERVGVLGGLPLEACRNFSSMPSWENNKGGDTPDNTDLLAGHEAAIRFLP